MTRFFLKIYDWLIVRHKVAYIAPCVVLLLCAVLSLRMHYDEDISAFIPLDEQTEKYSEVFNQMGGQDKIAVIFRGTDEMASIEKAMDAFGEAVARRDSGKIVRNLQVRMDETAMMELLQKVWQVYPMLLTEADYRHLDSLIAGGEDYLSEQMEYNKQMLMLPAGGMAAQSMPYDPLHISTGVLNRLRGLNVGHAYEVRSGYLFKEGAGIVLLESPFGISESRNNQQLECLLDSCMADVREACPSVSVSAVGAPLIAVTNASQIKSDSLLAVSLSVVLILLILLYSFRKIGDLMAIVVSVLAGWLFALGILSLMRDGISLIVIGIGSVIIGIAVNYPLHFIDHLKHETSMRETLKEMVPPLLVGNITTVSAFLCLVLLDAQAMRDLGLFGSLVLIGTILFVLVCLPVFLKPKKVKVADIPPRLLSLRRLGRFSQNKVMKRLTLWIVVGLTLVFGYFSRGTSFDSNMQNINYMLPEQREDLKFLSSSMQSQGDSLFMLYAVAEGKTLDAALRRNEVMTDSISAVEGVRRIAGIAGMMLSDSLRSLQMRRWQSFWNGRQSAVREFEKAAGQSGFSDEAFLPFEEMVRQSQVSDSAYQKSFFNLIGKQFVMSDETGYKVVNFVQVEKEHAGQIKEKIASAIPVDCFVFSQLDVSNHLAVALSDSFNYIGFVCGFVVFLFLWLSFGSIELSLMAFLPLATSWIWILGIMQILGLQFNIVNIILATFIFGQGDDYTIFITEGLMYEYTTGKRRLERYKSSVALSAVIMFIGIGTLIFSKHPAMRSLAEVAIIGMITVVVMAYYLPPLVFRWLTQKKGKMREYPVTLYRLVASVFSFTFFLCGMFFVLIPYTLLVHRPLQKVWNGEKFYHRLLQRISHFVIRRVPGVKFREVNEVGENFEKPAVIICNHQSHLDLMCLMQLSPKVIVLTNDWVWNNPYYGQVIHTAEFRPVSNGFDKNFPYLQNLVRKGYSIVVFPEGTRTPDGEIGRFHKGAFTLAKALELDVLPVFIHGLYDVLPKYDFMLRKGSVTLETGKRITFDSIKGLSDRAVTSMMHSFYIKHYAEMRRQLETPEYLAPYLAYKNKYKVKI